MVLLKAAATGTESGSQQRAACGQHGRSAGSVSAGVTCCLQMHRGLCQNGFAARSSGLPGGGLEGEMLRLLLPPSPRRLQQQKDRGNARLARCPRSAEKHRCRHRSVGAAIPVSCSGRPSSWWHRSCLPRVWLSLLLFYQNTCLPRAKPTRGRLCRCGIDAGVPPCWAKQSLIKVPRALAEQHMQNKSSFSKTMSSCFSRWNGEHQWPRLE